MYAQLFICLCALTLIIIILIVCIRNNNLKYDTFASVSVKSAINNNDYIVRDDIAHNVNDAADMMAQIRGRIHILHSYLQTRYLIINDYADGLGTLLHRLNQHNINIQEAPMNIDDPSDTTYTINKGETIFICLRNKHPPYQIHDINTLMYVVIHELAHIATISIGHTPEFRKNFAKLLTLATKLGIYRFVNYKVNPTAYCGILIK